MRHQDRDTFILISNDYILADDLWLFIVVLSHGLKRDNAEQYQQKIGFHKEMLIVVGNVP
jgi:hypothetical protein